MSLRRAALASLVLPLLWVGQALAYTSPGAPTGYVNDFANVLSAPTKAALEQELSMFEASTSNEVAVVTVHDLGGDYIENFAVKLFEEYKIGKAKEDNGVLLLLAIDDRKLRIEVGYGLEGALPDSLAQRIIDNEVVPSLKDGDYDTAVVSGVQAIEAATMGEYQGSGSSSGSTDWEHYIFLFIFLPLIVLQWLGAIFARSKSWWAGGVVGALAGVLVSTFLGWWLLWGIGITVGLFIIGLLFDLGVSNAFSNAKSAGTRPPWWGGGGFGGGSSGSSSSGGFGGSFGGGSSGGGGASGGW